MTATVEPDIPSNIAITLAIGYRTIILDAISDGTRDALTAPLHDAGFELWDGPPVRFADKGPLAVVVESDRGPGALLAVQDVRGRSPDAFVVAITGWWNDYESDLARAADAVLHVPLRPDQIQAVVTALQARAAAAAPVAPAM